LNGNGKKVDWHQEITRKGKKPSKNFHDENCLLFEVIYFTARTLLYRAEIFEESMGARNRGGIGLSDRPARLHRLAEFIPRNRFLGSINV
jgi:hypothetical protein